METEKKLQAKKEWKTPELTVLVRSKPEEAVLGACKSWVVGSAGANSRGLACGSEYDSAGCPACSDVPFG